ncbi:MAG: Xaa-Pro peptidase family protein [Phycisphaerae bacterium]
MSIADRVRRVRDAMRSAGLDALLVSNPLNVNYLSGYRCRSWSLCQPFDDVEALLLLQPERLAILVDDRHNPAAAVANGYSHGRIASPGGVGAIAREIEAQLAAPTVVVGFESDAILHTDATGLMQALSRVAWRAAESAFGALRIVKDAAEQDALRQAARITDAAFTHVLGQLELGMSEAEVGGEIDAYLRNHSEGLAFDTIVAFGANAASPHYHPSTTRKLARGDLVLMDFGAVCDGYHGDMTRTVFMGAADARQREVYHWVLEAQQACLAGIRAGMTEAQADALCRERLAGHGVADHFTHGTGHGVGLAIHEPPRLKKPFDRRLEAGTVVTVEPGLYFEGWGGIRIEDVVILGPNGSTNITHSPKQLMEIPC